MKKILLLLLFFVVVLSLFASDLIGYGTGTTEDEARLNARKDLLTSIQVDVSVDTTTSLYDDGENLENSFFENTKSSIYGILKGVEEKAVKNSSGIWEASCSILETKAYLYEREIKSLIESINSCQNEISKGLEPKEEIAYLETQLKKYELFDFYTDILLLLGYLNNDKPIVGKEIVQSRFSIILNQLDKPSVSSVDSEKSAAEYKKLLEEYEERQKLKEQIEKQNEEELLQYQKKLSDSQKEVLSSFESSAKEAYSKINVQETSLSSDFATLVASYVEARGSFCSLITENKRAVEKINSTNIALITNARKDIFNQPYDSLVEMKNGKPTDKALANRTEKANTETAQLIQTQNELYIEAYENFISSMKNFCTLYNPIKEKINNKSFSVSSLNDGTSFVVGRYDATTYSWPFAFSFSVLGHTFTVNGSLSNDEVKNLAKKAEKNWKVATEYRSLVELYDALYHSDWALMAECSYYSSIDVNSGRVNIKLGSFKVTRLDDDSTVSAGPLDDSYEYGFNGSNPLSLVFYALGCNQDDAQKRAISMFLGDELQALNVYDYKYEEQDGFGVARIEVSEDVLSEIVKIANSLNVDFVRNKSVAQSSGKGYEDLSSIIEGAKYVQKLLLCYGYDVPSNLAEGVQDREQIKIDALTLKYAAIISNSLAYSNLTNAAKKDFNQIKTALDANASSKLDENAIEISNEEVLLAFKTLVEKEIELSYSLSNYLYKDESKIENAFRDLQSYEKDVTSKSYYNVLPANAFDSSLEFDGKNIADTKILYKLKEEYKLKFGDFSFELKLKDMIGSLPSTYEEIEAYYDKAIAILCIYTGDYNAFTVEVTSCIRSNSENIYDSVESYITFSECFVDASYTVKSNYEDKDIYKSSTYVRKWKNGRKLSLAYTSNYKEDYKDKKDEENRIKEESMKNAPTSGLYLSGSSLGEEDFNGFIAVSAKIPYYKDFWFAEASANTLTGFMLNDLHGFGLYGVGGAFGFKTPSLSLGQYNDFRFEAFIKAGARGLLSESLLNGILGGSYLYLDLDLFIGADIFIAISSNFNIGISVDYSYGLKTTLTTTAYEDSINAYIYYKVSSY